MALLAGPKRKQKIGVNPNNLVWANDSTQVGQTLLAKMGWKKGSGLGAKEDGRVVPVKASLKMDKTGLGCSPQDADSWIAHQVEFDDILATLNKPSNKEANNDDSNKKNGATADDSTKDKVIDGERRFYGRFSRGGVKKVRTAEDLKSIIGRPARENKQEGKDTDTKSSKDSDENKDGKTEVDKVHGVVTTTSTSSVQDYFAQKMKAKKMAGNIPSSSILNRDSSAKQVEDAETDRPEDHICQDTYTKSQISVQEYFSLKMKAKKERLLTSQTALNSDTSGDKKTEADLKDEDNRSPPTGLDHGQETKSKSKRRSRKRKKNVDKSQEDISLQDAADDKQSKQKRHKVCPEVCDNEYDDTSRLPVVIGTSDNGAERKRGRKRAKADGDVGKESAIEGPQSCDEMVEVETQQKCGKKGKKREIEEAVEVEEEEGTIVDTGVKKEKKKKKKKKKKKED